MKDGFHLFGEIQKAEDQDDGTLIITGIASTEDVDSEGETVTADAMKAALPEYMQFGNIREMHQLKAAGVALEAEVNKAGQTWIKARIVDPTAIKKIKTEVYKGFSIGGRKTKRDELNKTIITGITLREISLVDRPCNPNAVFEMWKADGATKENDMTDAEKAALAKAEQEKNDAEDILMASGVEDLAKVGADETAEDIQKRAFTAKQRKADAKSGDAEKDGSFPIKNEEDLKNAIRAYGRSKDKAKTKAHIEARAKALGLSKELPENWHAGKSGTTTKDGEKEHGKKFKGKTMDKAAIAEDLKKYGGMKEMWDARCALDAVISIQNLLFSERAEDDATKDADQEAMLEACVSRLKSFIASEIMEGEEGDGLSDDELENAAKIRDLRKKGARNSKADKEHLGAIHKAAAAIQEHCGSMGYEEAEEGDGGDDGDKADKSTDLKKGDDMTKSPDDLKKLEQAATDLVKIAKAVGASDNETADQVFARVDELAKKAKQFDELPEPAKGALLGVDKANDVTKSDDSADIEKVAAEIDKLPEEQRGVALLKAIHERGGRPIEAE